MRNSSKFYGKVDQLDQASLEARRITRQRLTIIGISTIILVAIIVTAMVTTNHGSSDKSPSASAPPGPMLTSIKAICDSTLYPSSCLATLGPAAANLTNLDPVKLFHLSVEIAMAELAKSSEVVQELGLKGAVDKMSLAAFSDCEELIALAVDHLTDCLWSIDFFSNADAVDDLKTWLSSVITSQHTCIDGFDNSTVELKSSVHDAMKNSTELSSNSLAILTELYSLMGSVKLRKLMGHTDFDDHWSPSWLSSQDRRLLQSSDPRKNADAVVAKDGSGKYKTIKAAVKAAPEKSKERFVIYVKKGVYNEVVKVDKNKWHIMIVGDGMDSTVVSGGLNFIDGTPTFQSATFAVFGKGFIARDMGFRNTAGPQKQQAVAMMSDADQSVFYRCRFDAYQDTLYVHSLRQFYRECDIYGTVDFIFGNAAAVLQNCNILPRIPIPGQQDTITAQGKVDPNQNTGIVIHNCTVWPSVNLTSVKVYLGRPWKPYSTTVYLRSMLAGFIDPAGWLPWTGNAAPDTIFYSEYQNIGPGASTKNRVKWKGLRAMNSKQSDKFTVKSFIGGNKWIPKAGLPFKSSL